MNRLRRRPLAFWAGLAAAVLSLLVPIALNDSQLTVYVFIGLSVIVVAGLSLLMGFAGQVSLGQAAFYAIGAYTAAILTRALEVPPLLSLAAATAFTAVVAVAVGLPLLRLRGHYLAFATLAFQLIVLSVIGEARGLTGGDTGMPGIPTLSIGPLAIQGQYRTFIYAYVTWVLVAAVLLFNRNLVRSRPGRGLRALATSEAGALAAGVPVVRYKLQVFALSAAYAGLAGGVYAFFVSYIAPGSFPVLLSVQFLIMAAVGGLGSIWGSAVGATVVYLLVQLLQSLGTGPGLPPQLPAILSYAVYGLVLVLIMLFLPQGLLPAIQGRISARRAVSAVESPARLARLD
ncbi:MAG TPA: branched-chain amino acid ABC transporter permease [Candidatus Dormibacteraeota bacterium]|nr:branched-chain amino acid ABC transporter permease [Candidatus Dormibacteraeota bacterium]